MFILFLLTFFFSHSSKANYIYSADNVKVVDSRKFGKCLAFEVADYNTVGINAHRDKYSDMITYLAGSRFHYENQGVASLRNWVIKQKNNSITLTSIFRASLELNKGDLVETLLSLHELLRA